MVTFYRVVIYFYILGVIKQLQQETIKQVDVMRPPLGVRHSHLLKKLGYWSL